MKKQKNITKIAGSLIVLACFLPLKTEAQQKSIRELDKINIEQTYENEEEPVQISGNKNISIGNSILELDYSAEKRPEKSRIDLQTRLNELKADLTYKTQKEKEFFKAIFQKDFNNNSFDFSINSNQNYELSCLKRLDQGNYLTAKIEKQKNNNSSTKIDFFHKGKIDFQFQTHFKEDSKIKKAQLDIETKNNSYYRMYYSKNKYSIETRKKIEGIAINPKISYNAQTDKYILETKLEWKICEGFSTSLQTIFIPNKKFQNSTKIFYKKEF